MGWVFLPSYIPGFHKTWNTDPGTMVFEGIKHEHQRLKFHQGGCLDVILRNLPLVLVTPGPTPKKIYLKVNVFGPFKSWSCETFPTCLYREVVKPKNIYDIYEICYSIPLPFVCTSITHHVTSCSLTWVAFRDWWEQYAFIALMRFLR